MDKAQQGFCWIVKWNDLCKNQPVNLKISPLVAVPHKSKLWRAILDLSFEMEVSRRYLLAANEALAPEAVLNQKALPCLIAVVATAPGEDSNIIFANLDIKDGYWRMSVERGEEWNFVLPPVLGQAPDNIDLVAPSAVQMGWSESQVFFCAVSETA